MGTTDTSPWHSERIHITAYHPITNGMVERFHCQLKAALKTYHAPELWTQSLPMVLLLICTALFTHSAALNSYSSYVSTLNVFMQLLCATLPQPVQ